MTADLRDADLRGADLRGANLRDAELCGADLRNAELWAANLCGAELRNAELRDTCLDPRNRPNAHTRGFRVRGDGWVSGWRTVRTPAPGKQLVRDRYYAADVFSTADTECHPGWYLWPTREAAAAWAPDQPLALVRARSRDIHHAGTKWRARMIHVIAVDV